MPRVSGQIWRLGALEQTREEFILRQLDFALAAILIDRISADKLNLIERMNTGDETVTRDLAELKTKFKITDAQLRAYVESRYHEDLMRIDRQIQTAISTRDCITELIQKNRFMRLANRRFAAQSPQVLNAS